MEDLKKLVVAYISKTQGKTPEEVSSLLFKKEADVESLKDDALNALFDLDKSRVASFDNKNKEHYDKGYNKAKAETLAKFEGEIKDKFQFTEDKKGLDLVDAIIAGKVSNSELDDEKVLRSKKYLETVEQLKKEAAAKAKELQDRYDSREKELQEKATLSKVDKKALELLRKMNPDIADDLKETWEEVYLQKIHEFKFDVRQGANNDDIFQPLKKDGEEYKTYVDEHMHPVPFEDLAKATASRMFKFKQEPPGTGTGNNNDGTGAGEAKGYKGPRPVSEADYLKKLSEARSEEEKIEITKAWIGK